MNLSYISRLVAWIWKPITHAPDAPSRKPRALMGRVKCPFCDRQVAYSSTTHLTQPHYCSNSTTRLQQKIGPQQGENQ